MKRLLVAAAIFVCHSAALNATPIGITLGSTRITPFFATPFSDVSGVPLNGQSLSLNFVFTDNFIRLLPPPGFPQTAVNFDISVTLHTNADGFPGLAGWGKKAASSVLSVYPHLEDIPKDFREWTLSIHNIPRLARTLFACWDDALLFRKLATLRTDVPLFDTVEELRHAR